MKYLTLKEAVQVLLRQTSLALLTAVSCMLILEFVMPGSVLPIFDFMKILPFTVLTGIATGILYERKKGFGNFMGVVLGAIIIMALAGAVLIKMDQGGLRPVLLILAMLSAGGGWIYANTKPSS